MVGIPDPTYTLPLLKRLADNNDPLNAVTELFWLFYRHSYKSDSELSERLNTLASLLSQGGSFVDPEIDGIMKKGFDDPKSVVATIMDRLDTLMHDKRVPYQPDSESKPDDLYVYVHLAACRAIALSQQHGYSHEDIRSSVEEAISASRRLALATRKEGHTWIDSPPWPKVAYSATGDFSLDMSLMAVTGILFVSQFQALCNAGEYEEALHSLAKGLYISDEVQIFVSENLSEVRWINISDHLAETFPDQNLWPLDLQRQQAADAFELLRAFSKRVDWRRVEKDCENIDEYWPYSEEGTEHRIGVTDGEGELWEWSPFWSRARGWASAQMSPNDFRELQNETEDERAEKRLQTYFFAEPAWKSMPERARRALVDADRAWFSTKAGRVEASLIHLQAATESICHTVIWEPLLSLQKDQRIQEFSREVDSLKGKNPSLANYSWVCKQEFFKTFLAAFHLIPEEVDFLTRELPSALDALRQLRGPAEHDPKRIWSPQEVGPIVARFMGIGQKGVLKELLGLASELARRTPR